MKVGFLLLSPEINGGTNVILEHGAGLQNQGHQVSIITERSVAPEQYSWHPEGSNLRWRTFSEAQKDKFDCVIATWWESPYLLQKFEATQYIYFVQSIESRFFKDDDPADMDFRDHSTGATRCMHSYYFSLPVITEAAWIKRYLELHCNQQPYLVRNGIRKELYAGNAIIEEKPKDGLRVLIEGPVEVFHKNVPRSIELCRQAGVDEVWLLTSSVVAEMEGVDRLFSQVPLAATPPIYRSCHVLVKLSAVEGMFGPPLEMFHCGGTAIVYDVTGHDEYIEHETNGLVVKQGDEAQVVQYLKMLTEDGDLLSRLCKGAQKTAAAWDDWHQSSEEFAQALGEIMEQPRVSRKYLENISEVFNSYQTLQLESRELQRLAEREGGEQDEGHHNFVQAYELSQNRIIAQAWCHYMSGGLAKISCKLNVAGEDTQIRLDPSARIGLVCLYRIVIKAEAGEELADYNPASFDRLFVTGTARWLKKTDDYWVLYSFGNDPQILLPSLQALPAQTIEVEITLRELGVGRYLKELESQRNQSGKSPGLISSLRNLLRS